MPTHCFFCGVQCGMDLRVQGGKVVGVERRDFPHDRGSPCPKEVVAHQQGGHPRRLLHPMRWEPSVRIDHAYPVATQGGSRRLVAVASGSPSLARPQRWDEKVALQGSGG